MVIRYQRVLFIGLLLLVLLSSVRYSDSIDFWLVDILSQFRIQYALLAICTLIVCVLRRLIWQSLVAVLLVITNANALIDMDRIVHATAPFEKTIKVYSANINKSNSDLSRLEKDVKMTAADIVFLAEVTPHQMDRLSGLVEGFPYHVKNPSIQIDGIGTVLLSKYPLSNHKIKKFSSKGNSLLEAELNIDHMIVKFYGTHFVRPDRHDSFEIRRDHFLDLARQVAADSKPVIVAGDFNATPFSPIFRVLLRISGLRDSREGFGWQPSWPAYFPLLLIPIDHVLVTPDFQVHRRATGSHIGSDHYPVFAELSLNQNAVSNSGQ